MPCLKYILNQLFKLLDGLYLPYMTGQTVSEDSATIAELEYVTNISVIIWESQNPSWSTFFLYFYYKVNVKDIKHVYSEYHNRTYQLRITYQAFQRPLHHSAWMPLEWNPETYQTQRSRPQALTMATVYLPLEGFIFFRPVVVNMAAG